MQATIGTRLFLAFLLLTFLPTVGVLTLVHNLARNSLESTAYRTLRAVRESKRQQIQSSFDFYYQFLKSLAENPSLVEDTQSLSRRTQSLRSHPVATQTRQQIHHWYHEEYARKLKIISQQDPRLQEIMPKTPVAQILQQAYIAENPNPVWQKYLLDHSGRLPKYDALHRRIHPSLLNVRERMQLRDIVLVDENARIVYSTDKLPNFGTSLTKGPWKNTPLAQACLRTQTQPSAAEDFTPFMPALMEQTAFITHRLQINGDWKGCIAFQISPQILNQVMSGDRNWKQEQLGETGETYVVGPDYKMRNESRFSQEEYSRLQDILGLDQQPQALSNGSRAMTLSVRTPAVRAALNGETGTMVQRAYHDRKVLCAYTPVDIHGGTWAILAEMELEEVLSPIDEFTSIMVQAGVAMLVLLILIAVRVTRSITAPINQMAEAARRFAAGDFQAILPRGSQDEIGELSRTFEHMRKSILNHRESLEIEVEERRQAEINAKQSRHTLQTILEEIPQAIAWKSADGTYVEKNPAWIRLEESLPASAMNTVLTLETSLRQSAGSVLHERLDLEGPEGRLFLDLSLRDLQENQEHTGLLITIHDNTSNIQLERQLQTHQKLESLGSIAGGIAHDFNNLLMAVTGFIELATQKPQQSDSYLQKALGACDRAKNLSHQLLVFARGGSPVKKTMPIVPVIKEAVHLGLTGSSVTTHYTIEPDLPAVYADESQIHQAIHNLTINARQALNGNGNLMIEVCLSNECPGSAYIDRKQFILIEITDDGPGIPNAEKDRIFEPFYTTKPQGSGLGLANTYGIILKHEGFIQIKPDTIQGTCFQIWLPVTSQIMKPVESKPEVTVSNAATARILVLDDEDAVLEITTSFLEVLGYESGCVRTGEECITSVQAAHASGRPYDLIIMDLTIPGCPLGGAGTAARIRELFPEMRMLISSGYSDDEVMARYQEHGFHGVLQKPCSLESLGQVLNEVLYSQHV